LARRQPAFSGTVAKVTRSVSGKPLKEEIGMVGIADGAGRGLVRQGDVLLVPVEGLPKRAGVVGRGRVVLAEGEATGHVHVVEDARASLHREGRDGTTFLHVADDGPVALVHEEHDRLWLAPGVYRVVRQREYEPGWRWSRRVAD
jgi:hypothetical protein